MKWFKLVRAAAIFALIIAANQAMAAEWKIIKSFGDAWVDNDGSGRVAKNVALKKGRMLFGRATVTTGSNGRVIMVRGRESMVVGPNARIDFFAGRPGMTSIRQQSGVVSYDVEKRNVRHFEVRTPTMTAIVKGTKFQVTQIAGSSAVRVMRGAVQVVHRSGGEDVLVRAGQKLIVRNGQMRLVKPVPGLPVARLATADGLASGKSRGKKPFNGLPRGAGTDAADSTPMF